MADYNIKKTKKNLKSDIKDNVMFRLFSETKGNGWMVNRKEDMTCLTGEQTYPPNTFTYHICNKYFDD